MPIYEYACPDCGHQNDHMQKLADAPIASCPKCGSSKYYKKISAAGFALKGTGWYVTDFRDGGKKPADKKDGDAAAAPSPAPEAPAASSDAAATPSTTPAPAAPPPPAPAPAASPAPSTDSK
jgi:putative FmdB family regulatory protein